MQELSWDEKVAEAEEEEEEEKEPDLPILQEPKGPGNVKINIDNTWGMVFDTSFGSID